MAFPERRRAMNNESKFPTPTPIGDELWTEFIRLYPNGLTGMKIPIPVNFPLGMGEEVEVDLGRVVGKFVSDLLVRTMLLGRAAAHGHTSCIVGPWCLAKPQGCPPCIDEIPECVRKLAQSVLGTSK
jgi:hypothetical protein